MPNIFDHPFTYLSNIKLKPGDYVKVPFGKKNIIGVIWDIFEEKNNKEFKLKSINEKIEIGKSRIVQEGNKLAILNFGARLNETLKAAENLKKKVLILQ